MNQGQRPEPFFIGEQAAADFLNSVCAPWGEEIEWVDNGADYIHWLLQAQLLPKAVAKRYLETYADSELDDIARQARDLREQFRALIQHLATGNFAKSVDTDSVDFLNQILSQDQCYTTLEVDPALHHFQQVEHRHWDKTADLLLPLAASMAALLCHPDLAQLKNCENPACTLWFLDTSKNHKRRWCSMAVCGNRAKVAAHRARKKATN